MKCAVGCGRAAAEGSNLCAPCEAAVKFNAPAGRKAEAKKMSKARMKKGEKGIPAELLYEHPEELPGPAGQRSAPEILDCLYEVVSGASAPAKYGLKDVARAEELLKASGKDGEAVLARARAARELREDSARLKASLAKPAELDLVGPEDEEDAAEEARRDDDEIDPEAEAAYERAHAGDPAPSLPEGTGSSEFDGQHARVTVDEKGVRRNAAGQKLYGKRGETCAEMRARKAAERAADPRAGRRAAVHEVQRAVRRLAQHDWDALGISGVDAALALLRNAAKASAPAPWGASGFAPGQLVRVAAKHAALYEDALTDAQIEGGLRVKTVQKKHAVLVCVEPPVGTEGPPGGTFAGVLPLAHLELVK